MKAIVLVATAFLLTGPACLAQTGEDGQPLVRVNGHIITRGELVRHVRVLRYGAEPADDVTPLAADVDELAVEKRKEFIEALVEKHLILGEARSRYEENEATRDSLDAFAREELQKLEKRVGSRLKARRLLMDIGLSTEDFKQLRIEALLIARFLFDKVYRHVDVTPVELRAYFQGHYEEFHAPKTVVYRQILFIAGEETEETQRQKAETVLAKLREGADFAEMAQKHTADRDQFPGGLHELKLSDGQADWMPPAVAGLEEGDLSDVRKVGGGFSIALLEAVKPARAMSFGEAQGDIRERLLQQKRAEAEAEYIARLRRNADIEHYPAAGQFGLKD